MDRCFFLKNPLKGIARGLLISPGNNMKNGKNLFNYLTMAISYYVRTNRSGKL